MVFPTINNFYGLYIHIPFCITKCPYCSFYSVTDLSKVNEYFFALNAELELYKHKRYNVDTIYFGGGTPSVINFNYIYSVLESIYNNFCVILKPEITIEINPGTVCYQKLKDYYSVGINRLSIGVQSTCNTTLSFLGRSHNRDDIFKIFSWSREIGFCNIGVDLIYGIPKQSASMWQQEMWEIVKMKPEHISCYLLDLDPKTPMGSKVMKGTITPLNDNILASSLIFTGDFLSGLGYFQYEISNFAKNLLGKTDIYTSKHNSKYWNFNNYIGFGPSAHSYAENTRWWNHSCLDLYTEDTINRGILPISGGEKLTLRQQMIEFIYLGLRQSSGIDTNLFKDKFLNDIFTFFEKTIFTLLEDYFIQIDEDRIKLTKKGLPLLDSVVLRFCS